MAKLCVVCGDEVTVFKTYVYDGQAHYRYNKTCSDQCKSLALASNGKKNKNRKHTAESRANMASAHRKSNSRYIAAHMRVRRLRGSASGYACPCGRQAVHWSFQWRSTPQDRWMIDEAPSSRGGPSMYSLTESDYKALCGRCASWYDKADQVREFYGHSLA